MKSVKIILLLFSLILNRSNSCHDICGQIRLSWFVRHHWQKSITPHKTKPPTPHRAKRWSGYCDIHNKIQTIIFIILIITTFYLSLSSLTGFISRKLPKKHRPEQYSDIICVSRWCWSDTIAWSSYHVTTIYDEHGERGGTLILVLLFCIVLFLMNDIICESEIFFFIQIFIVPAFQETSIEWNLKEMFPKSKDDLTSLWEKEHVIPFLYVNYIAKVQMQCRWN